jgi:hypothetical protein
VYIVNRDGDSDDCRPKLGTAAGEGEIMCWQNNENRVSNERVSLETSPERIEADQIVRLRGAKVPDAELVPPLLRLPPGKSIFDPRNWLA